MNVSTLHWKTEYDTGIEEIDLQHRYFMVLINRLTSELVTCSDKKYRERLLRELANYAAFHFVSEENLMIKFGYPDFERHRMLHLDLIDQLSLRMLAESNESLLKFLVAWFIRHTISEDHRIGEFVLVGSHAETQG
jgi:hemerythrin